LLEVPKRHTKFEEESLPLSLLFTLKIRSLSSVVPRKLEEDKPLLPVVSQFCAVVCCMQYAKSISK
jgi:hypothetical protein